MLGAVIYVYNFIYVYIYITIYTNIYICMMFGNLTHGIPVKEACGKHNQPIKQMVGLWHISPYSKMVAQRVGTEERKCSLICG